MKKFFLHILAIITILLIFYMIIFYNIKIVNVERGKQGELITINIMGKELKYYFESEM